MAGGFNWARLGFDYTGIPLAFGAKGRLRELKDEKFDFDKKELIDSKIKELAKAQRTVTRGVVGIGTLAGITALTAAIGTIRERKPDEEQEEGLAGVFRNAWNAYQKNWVISKAFQKMAGQWAVAYYTWQKFKGVHDESAGEATLEFLDNVTNMNMEYSTPVRVYQAASAFRQDNPEKANKILGELAGSFVIPGGPPVAPLSFFRNYRDLYDIAATLSKNVTEGTWETGPRPMPPKAENAVEGFFWNGLTESVMNNFVPSDIATPLQMEDWAADREVQMDKAVKAMRKHVKL
jgi:hypothetical protein